MSVLIHLYTFISHKHSDFTIRFCNFKTITARFIHLKDGRPNVYLASFCSSLQHSCWLFFYHCLNRFENSNQPQKSLWVQTMTGYSVSNSMRKWGKCKRIKSEKLFNLIGSVIENAIKESWDMFSRYLSLCKLWYWIMGSCIFCLYFVINEIFDWMFHCDKVLGRGLMKDLYNIDWVLNALFQGRLSILSRTHNRTSMVNEFRICLGSLNWNQFSWSNYRPQFYHYHRHPNSVWVEVRTKNEQILSTKLILMNWIHFYFLLLSQMTDASTTKTVHRLSGRPDAKYSIDEIFGSFPSQIIQWTKLS